jgi:hypothetical protein
MVGGGACDNSPCVAQPQMQWQITANSLAIPLERFREPDFEADITKRGWMIRPCIKHFSLPLCRHTFPAAEHTMLITLSYSFLTSS